MIIDSARTGNANEYTRIDGARKGRGMGNP